MLNEYDQKKNKIQPKINFSEVRVGWNKDKVYNASNIAYTIKKYLRTDCFCYYK
jgi:hypothetical protein